MWLTSVKLLKIVKTNVTDAIEFVINQTPYLCMIAIQSKPTALQYVKTQTNISR